MSQHDKCMNHESTDLKSFLQNPSWKSTDDRFVKQFDSILKYKNDVQSETKSTKQIFRSEKSND